MKRSIVPLVGGKAKVVDQILAVFPPHQVYVEPYGGTAVVLLNKPPVEIEVYNDINLQLFYLFKVLREQPEALRRALVLTPYHRHEFVRALDTDWLPTSPEEEVEYARRAFVQYRMAYGGRGQERPTWTSNRCPEGRALCKGVSAWLTAIDGVLPYVAQRFRRVQIECREALDVIHRYDGPHTLFYVDPPYLPSTRGDRIYYGTGEMTWEDHRQLACVLNEVQGAVVLSGYPSASYEEWYERLGWRRVDLTYRAQILKGGGKVVPESLWLSPRVRSVGYQLRLFD